MTEATPFESVVDVETMLDKLREFRPSEREYLKLPGATRDGMLEFERFTRQSNTVGDVLILMARKHGCEIGGHIDDETSISVLYLNFPEMPLLRTLAVLQGDFQPIWLMATPDELAKVVVSLIKVMEMKRRKFAN